MMKKCSYCKIEKPITDFSKHKIYGLQCYCKKCNAIQNKEWKKNNLEKHSEYNYTYNTSERGFLRNKISHIFTPKLIKRTGYKPDCTKEDIEKHFYDYVDKHGRNCTYCGEPWTYSAKKVYFGNGVTSRKGLKRENLKNLSFDRLDSSKTYSTDNIVFCCSKCNLSKRDISIEMIKRLYEIITERKL